jgi:hypothetical protein
VRVGSVAAGAGRECAPAALDRALLGGPSTSPLAARMRRQLGRVLALLVAAALAYADSGSPLLHRLGLDLKSLRSLPVGTPTHAVCPDDSGTLVGLTQRQVRTELSKPDFVDNDGSWTYFFTSPVPLGQFGGGFPELRFSFDARKVVARVSCFYLTDRVAANNRWRGP